MSKKNTNFQYFHLYQNLSYLYLSTMYSQMEGNIPFQIWQRDHLVAFTSTFFCPGKKYFQDLDSGIFSSEMNRVEAIVAGLVWAHRVTLNLM